VVSELCCSKRPGFVRIFRYNSLGSDSAKAFFLLEPAWVPYVMPMLPGS
jgi:hypothetical protein